MNILEARFANQANDLIAVLYKDENNENIEMYVEVNENDSTYKSLVQAGYSKEVIIENTVEAKKAHMRKVYDILKEQHRGQHEKVMSDLEKERLEKIDEINKLEEVIELKRQQFLISIAALEAIRLK